MNEKLNTITPQPKCVVHDFDPRNLRCRNCGISDIEFAAQEAGCTIPIGKSTLVTCNRCGDKYDILRYHVDQARNISMVVTCLRCKRLHQLIVPWHVKENSELASELYKMTKPMTEAQTQIQIKDSGDRTDFGTGAVRDMQHGKGRMDLLPMRALIEVSKLYEAGCLKYGDRNWEKGIPLKSFINSGMRHLAKFMSGVTDEAHLTQATWNLLCALDTVLRVQEGVLTPSLLQDMPFDKIKLMTELYQMGEPVNG